MLYLASRRYSSWSLRAWLAVRLAGLDVGETVLPIDGSGASPALRGLSPSGRLPYLVHRGVALWESTAIAEYCAEAAPALYPADPVARGLARSIAHEMHAGFRALRLAMPMVLGRRFPPRPLAPEVAGDIARIETIWRETRTRHGAGGPFLFGAGFSLADAMYAPVVARFDTYQPRLSAESLAYCASVRSYSLIGEWCDAAAAEPAEWRIPSYEEGPH